LVSAQNQKISAIKQGIEQGIRGISPYRIVRKVLSDHFSPVDRPRAGNQQGILTLAVESRVFAKWVPRLNSGLTGENAVKLGFLLQCSFPNIRIQA
jgi:hypothetical protein